jgi:hypothetical protein
MRRSELRQLILDAALRVAQSEGLGLGGSNITFKRVFADVQDETGVSVTNASVINSIWRNLDDFRIDVLLELVKRENERELDILTNNLLEIYTGRDLSTVERLRDSLTEMVRVACNTYAESSRQTHARYQLVYGLHERDHELAPATQALRASFIESNRLFINRYGGLYEAALASVGWRIREEFDVRTITTILSSIAEGIVLHHRIFDDESPVMMLATGPNGDLREWSSLALVVNSLLDHVSEPDPSFVTH